jgi:lactoylglutathione lyase
MQYLHSMLRVKDLDAALDFFCHKLGLEEFRRHEVESGRFTLVFLCAPGDLDKTQALPSPLLELTYNWPSEDGSQEEYSQGRNFGHLAYQVENIYQLCQQLQDKGVDILRPPRDGRMAFIQSPDGISIELLQQGDALEPREPWLSMQNSGSW